MRKFEGRVTAVGPLVAEFLEHNIVVLFGEGAPEELAEFTILHDGKGVAAPIEAGDHVHIDTAAFKILAVGDVANSNLKHLGHLVLKFNGAEEVEMPGDVCVEARPLPPIAVGTTIRIEGQAEA